MERSDFEHLDALVERYGKFKGKHGDVLALFLVVFNFVTIPIIAFFYTYLFIYLYFGWLFIFIIIVLFLIYIFLMDVLFKYGIFICYDPFERHDYKTKDIDIDNEIQEDMINELDAEIKKEKEKLNEK